MKEEAIHWVGMDVAKKTFDAALVRPGQHYPHTPLRDVPATTFERTPQGVRSFLDWLDGLAPGATGQPAEARVVMESTGSYSVELAAWLLEQRGGLQPAIVNPHRTSNFMKSLGLRNKTDRVEARALAFYGAERRPAPYEALSPARARLRELSRYRDVLVQECTATKNQGGATHPVKAIRDVAKRRLRQLECDIKRIERQMKVLVQDTEDLRHDYELLVTLPGVAFVTACVMLAELGNLGRFTRARQISAFAGVSCRNFKSGTSVNGRPRMCKSGNRRVRQALYLAAMAAVRIRGPLKEFYDQLKKNGKKPMVALGAVMRKLIVLMRAIIISRTPYDRDFKKGGRPCGQLA